MQEIRLHGRGGQGLVKASHLVVKTAVETGHYGQFIPFFGVERKGSPVFGFLRLSEEEIRRKTQVYEPDVLIILDDTLVHLPATYAGLKEGGTVVINSVHDAAALQIPAQAHQTPPPYLRVLGMNERGREILSRMKRTASLPVSVSLSRLAQSSSEAAALAALEAACADQYGLFTEQIFPCGLDYSEPVVKG